MDKNKASVVSGLIWAIVFITAILAFAVVNMHDNDNGVKIEQIKENK